MILSSQYTTVHLNEKMGLRCLWIFCISTLIVAKTTSLIVVNSQVQGCSVVGIELQHCLNPSTSGTPVSLSGCCIALKKALEAGYYCLCSLLGPSDHPVFSTEITLSFSSCYVSMPPLTHCQVLEPNPVVAPPVAALPTPNNQPPDSPVLMPPDMPRDSSFVPLPPKMNENSPDSTNDSSSTIKGNSSLKSSVPELGDHMIDMPSNSANSEMLLHPINFLIAVILVYIA